jgi:periplasmic protein TonB
MAFTDRRPDSHRAAKIIAVSAFQATVIYGLVVGLAVNIVTTDPPTFTARPYPSDPPPLPELPPVEPARVIKDLPPMTPPIHEPLGVNAGDFHFDPFAPPPLPPLTGPTGILPPLTSKPKFVLAGPRPRNNPAGWVSTNDYPSRDIREGNEGTARFLLSIDARGKVRGCEIVSSSGHPGLDKATCKTVTRRARFEPASDGLGERVAGTYSSAVRWVIPED